MAERVIIKNRKRVNLEVPRWDQSTYWGRYRHFWHITHPKHLLASNAKLERAKAVVTAYRREQPIPKGTTVSEIWRLKHLYDSSFHPETGEKMFILGRMSAQVPSNMVITGFMLQFYKTLPAVIFWQWVNQSFNAIVNLSNHSGDSVKKTGDILTHYAAATSGAIVAAVGLNRIAGRFPPIVNRLVPFAAVAAANAVNLPLSRQDEIINGMKVTDKEGNTLGHSSKTAKIAITQVVCSRILMAVPSMVGIPILMNQLEKAGVLKKYPRLSLPLQVSACGAMLLFATPAGCALFPQHASIPVAWLEPELRDKIKAMPNAPKEVYYNKGL